MSETNLLSANNTNNPNNIKILKYPVPRLEYTYKTGSIAEKLVSDILTEEGIEVEPHNVNENGVDIRAKNVDIGIEVWNWCKPHEYNSRIQSIIENLKPYPFRALVTSFISKDVRDYIESTYVLSPIFVVELGFQILPKEWKQFYKNRKNVVYYPSREAYVKVRQRMKPLIDAIKRVRRDKILAKYFPSYEHGDMVILDASGCTNEEFNNFLRDLKEHKEKVALISVPEPSVGSPFNKSLSTKEPFNAYVYENNLNLKNESLKIRAKERETEKTENKEARTEEKTESSTFRDKFRTELAKTCKLLNGIMNFLFSVRMLLNGYDLKCVSDLKYVSKSNINSKDEAGKNVNSKNETERNEARTEEKTKSSTLNDYTVPPSGGGTEKSSNLSSTFTVGTETVPMKLKHSDVPSEGTTVKSSHFSTTFNDKPSSLKHNPVPSEGRGLETKEISGDSKEISPSKGKISTVSVKIRAFYNRLKTLMLNLLFQFIHDTSGRLPKTRKWIMSAYGNRSILEYCSDKMKRSKLHPIIKTCPYKTILVCKMKYFKPKYVCGFPFQNKIRYCDYCKDVPDEEIMDLYGRPICKYYNERCDIILQSYEYVNLENSQICYWISRSERVKVLRELEKYRGENRCPNKH